MLELKETKISDSVASLQDIFQKEGYLFIRSFFAEDLIQLARKQIINVLEIEGWGSFSGEDFIAINPVHRINSPLFHQCISHLMKQEILHKLSEDPALCNFLTSLLGEPIFPHPRKMIRITYPYSMNPKDLIPPHQDLFYVKGERDTFTAWIPLGDYPPEKGGLQVSPGTHHKGLFPTESNEEGRFGCASVEKNLTDFLWYKAHYRPGDLLVMHSLTLHRSGINQSKQFRLSLDCRFSSALRTINEDQLFPPYYPHVPNWAALSEHWENPERFCLPQTMQVHPREKKISEVLLTPSRFIE